MSLAKVEKVAEADFPTRWGHFRIHGFRGEHRSGKSEEVLALVIGEVAKAAADATAAAPLVRIHSQCMTGDVFGSLRCDCRQQLEMALEAIAASGCGVLVYERQEGRGIGLLNKLKAYELQDAGLDTVEANLKLGFASDCRSYELPTRVLAELGVSRLRLLSNNPEKVSAVEAAGIVVSERTPIEATPTEHSAKYLRTKVEKMGHLLADE